MRDPTLKSQIHIDFLKLRFQNTNKTSFDRAIHGNLDKNAQSVFGEFPRKVE